VLAYVFWHRPREGVDRDRYEDALARFHESLENTSAVFRLDRLPFGDGGPGYEDWYLVEGWAELGELNAAAVDAQHRPRHDAAAEHTANGWGGVYALLRGPAEPPASAQWQPRAPGDGTAAVWRRQMVLGPAPEFCVGETGGQAPSFTEGRVPIRDSRSS
jgi:hypothetical protein